jgi:glycosyltransferase involved in cell wall biosynthesis
LKRVRVAFVASVDPPFVQRDREILSQTFALRDVRWRGKRSIPALAAAVSRSDVTFSWFALDHAYGACRLARLFHKKSIVFVGGVDAAKRADLEYGVYLDPAKGALSRYAVTHSDRVLVVDDRLREDLHLNAGLDRPDIETVPLGFDTTWFSPGDGSRSTVLTVGIVTDVNLRRKGLLTFLEAARLLPGLSFVLVGARDNAATTRLRAVAPPNVRILGRIRDEELREEYRHARVYVQLSEYEAFGSSLGEAMACGCVPVGTRAGGIPTLIGESGSYVPPGDAEAAAQAIEAAFESGDGNSARQRIVENFPLDRRRDSLRRIVQDLADSR